MTYPITLRPHQVRAVDDIDRLFEENPLCKAICSVLPTGAGKTLVKAFLARRAYDRGETVFLIAHRDVLLGQISDALCMYHVPHTFICSDDTRRDITNLNMQKHGDHFYDERSSVMVISVATFAARMRKGTIPQSLLNRVSLWLQDETHHLTQGSQWGDLVESLPNARGVGVTATPIRGDRKGLGRHAHGYFDELSVTTSMLELVKAGYLTRMKVYQPTTLDTTECKRGKNGDYTEKSLAAATKKAGTHITGSAIEYYEKFIWGQPAITFAVNIEHGKEIAKKFNEAGIPTQFVSSKSKESVRKQAVADLRSGKLWNLVNVDLFGEGFDAPAVAGIFMLRKTESYSLYKQQIGRCLRPSEGKEYGYVFDHVGNVALMLEKFGLLTPYHDPEWTLDSYGKSSSNDDDDDSDIPPVMNCPKCHYEGPYYDVIDEVTGEVDLPGFVQPDGSYRCPDEDCGHVFGDDESEVVVRQIQEKKGELKEMNFDEIAELIEKRDNEIFKPVGELNVYSDGKVGKSIRNRHVNRQNAIDTLRIKINQWCNNVRKETGWTHELVRREFESTFGVNIYAAQVLSAPKATELTEKIQKNETSRTLRTMRKTG